MIPLYHPVLIKDKQRFWKRILIIDDDEDVTITFKARIQDTNNNNDANISGFFRDKPGRLHIETKKQDRMRYKWANVKYIIYYV